MAPAGVIRPIRIDGIENHMLPSAASVIELGGPDTGYSVTTPHGVTLPTWLVAPSANQTLPSGPVPIAQARPGSGSGYSEMTPSGPILPMLPVSSVNHMAPSAPRVIALGGPLLPTGYSTTLPSGVTRPI